MTEQMHNISTAPIAPYHYPAGSAAAPPFPPPPVHHHHHMHHHHHGGGRWRRGGGGRGFGPGGGVGRATTRLARHTKARTLVTELAKLATQPTPEALQGVAAPKQKTRGINKDQVFEVFDSLVNTQLAPQERVTRSSVWKYLFRGSKTSGQVVEPLYGNEKIFKTTKKGGGVRRLTGVMWRDLDTPENRDAVSASLAALEAYSVHIDLEQLKGLIQQELVKDADADAIVDDSPASPAAADTTTTTTTTTTTASSSSSDPMGGITHTGVSTAAAAAASPSASATPSSSSLPYALPTNTSATAPPPVPQAEAMRQPPPQPQPHHMQQEPQPYHRDERGSGEQAAAPPDQSSSSSSSPQGSNPAMDSDLQQLLKLLTQKETLEKLQAMVVNK